VAKVDEPAADSLPQEIIFYAATHASAKRRPRDHAA